jgi:hypothetical protein
LKAENYLLNCRVETISSPSKQALRIFQTSPEHPNARIIITPSFANSSPKASRPASTPGDIFDPRPPKPRKSSTNVSDDNARRSSRKRTVKVYDDSSSDFDSEDEEPDSKRRKSNTKPRRVSEIKDVAVMSSPADPKRRKSASKPAEPSEVTPKKKENKEKTWRPSSSGKANREKEARLDRRENEELYETLQKQVTIDLLKRRYSSFQYTTNIRGIPTTEQEEMVADICRKLGVESNTDLVTRATTSVRYWVAHKSWRLRDHFKVLGISFKRRI